MTTPPPTLRAQFPALDREVHGHPLAYLDSAATAQKPQTVLDALHHAYVDLCANVHRGVHTLSQRATDAYEASRDRVQGFLGAEAREEIVFTRGTTEAINLVAHSWGRRNVRAGDRLVVSEMEHHANIVPWQLLADEVGAEVVVLPFDDRGELRLELLDDLLDERTRLVAVTHQSNSLGTVNDVAAICARARAIGALTVVDGAQAVCHQPVDVRALGCDFYAFSGHKLFGPSGAGALYGRRALLEAMPPWQGGGEMILHVSFEGTTFHEVPHRFEAGTPAIAEVIGLGAAIDWVEATGWDTIQAIEGALFARLTRGLEAMDDVHLIGTSATKGPIASFVLDGIHPHDVGTILDLRGVAVRTGHHCTQPTMDHYDLAATVRASLAPYNHEQDVDQLLAGLAVVRDTFR